MRTNSIKTVIIPSYGDQGIYTAGQPVYTEPSWLGANDSTVLVAPGQLVLYNPVTHLSVATNISNNVANEIQVGVGVDTTGTGVSSYIRWTDRLSGCGLQNTSAVPSECGVLPIVDAFFGCIECGNTYTIKVVYKSNETDGFAGENKGYTYYFSYTPPCPECPADDCPSEVSADVVQCGLANIINGGHDPAWSVLLNGRPYPGTPALPFTVSQLYDDTGAVGAAATTFEYCLAGITPTVSCEDCQYVEGISGFTSADAELDVVFTSTLSTINVGTDDEEEVTVSGRLEYIANQITLALDGNGSATVIKQTGHCCPYRLEINTCLTDFALLDESGVEIEPCGATNPFTDVAVFQECTDCDNPDATKRFNNGWRFKGKSIETECDCFAANRTKAWYSSEIEVYLLGDFVPSETYINVVQTGTNPKGQGFVWEAKEYHSLRVGNGESFSRGIRGGRHHLPTDKDVLAHILTECNEDYCVIAGQNKVSKSEDIAGLQRWPKVTNYFLIPQDDTTTQTQFLAFWNSFFDGSGCNKPDVSCEADASS